MFSISQVTELTGISAYTLRYYEKIGLLPEPKRKNGQTRVYSERDVKFIHFITNLKKTKMSLEEIKEFVLDGCIVEKIDAEEDILPSLTKRIQILSTHLIQMEAQYQELEKIIALTKEKLSVYQSLLEGENAGSEFE